MNQAKRYEIFSRLQQENPKPTTELQYSSPFELLIAVILSAQATDVSVNKATARLFAVANTPQSILALGEDGLKKYVKTIGLYNSKAKNIIKTCEILIEKHHGQVPEKQKDLEALPGVGRKTANVVRNTAFGHPTIAVDTHIFRVANRTKIAPGKTVLVLGSGISGLLHIHLARVMGATRVVATDIDTCRLDAAQRFGADHAVPANEDVSACLRDMNEGRLADCVIVCTGAVPALHQALASVDRGGTVLFFAPTDRDVTIPFSINQVFWRNDVTLTTSYAGDRADHLTALKLIQTQRVKVADMITHRLSLAETVRGFELVAKGSNSIKVVIEPQR